MTKTRWTPVPLRVVGPCGCEWLLTPTYMTHVTWSDGDDCNARDRATGWYQAVRDNPALAYAILAAGYAMASGARRPNGSWLTVIDQEDKTAAQLTLALARVAELEGQLDGHAATRRKVASLTERLEAAEKTNASARVTKDWADRLIARLEAAEVVAEAGQRWCRAERAVYHARGSSSEPAERDELLCAQIAMREALRAHAALKDSSGNAVPSPGKPGNLPEGPLPRTNLFRPALKGGANANAVPRTTNDVEVASPADSTSAKGECPRCDGGYVSHGSCSVPDCDHEEPCEHCARGILTDRTTEDYVLTQLKRYRDEAVAKAKQLDAHVDLVERLTGERDEARREREVLASVSSQGAWIWSDSDPNHLESLVEDAAVQIRAGQLRSLLRAREDQALRELAAWCREQAEDERRAAIHAESDTCRDLRTGGAVGLSRAGLRLLSRARSLTSSKRDSTDSGTSARSDGNSEEHERRARADAHRRASAEFRALSPEQQRQRMRDAGLDLPRPVCPRCGNEMARIQGEPPSCVAPGCLTEESAK